MASRGFTSRRAPWPVRSTATTASTRRSERRNGTRRSQHQAPCAPPWTNTKLVIGTPASALSTVLERRTRLDADRDLRESADVGLVGARRAGFVDFVVGEAGADLLEDDARFEAREGFSDADVVPVA